MVNLQKSGDSAVKFVFTDSDHYLYGNGEIEVPVNSLLLVIDESDMVTFKKLSGDPFLSFRADNSNLGTKAAIEQFYKDNMVGSTGGGSESGITSGEVQTMIDNSLEDYYTDDEVDAALSGKASISDVTAVANDVQTVSGQVATKVAITDFNAYSAATDARIAEDEEVTAAALNDLDENKYDKVSGLTIQYDIDVQAPEVAMEFVDEEELGTVSNLYNKWGVDLFREDVETGHNIGASILNDGTVAVYEHSEGQEGDEDEGIAYDKGLNLYTDRLEINDLANGEGYTSSDTVMITKDVITMNKSVTDGQDEASSSIEINNNQGGGDGVFINLNDGSKALDLNTTNFDWTDGGTAKQLNWGDIASLDDIDAAVSGKVDTSAITSAITSASTNDEVAGAKATYDAITAATTGGGATYSAGTNISIDTGNTINCTLNLRNGTGLNSITGVQGEAKGQYNFAFGQGSTAGTSTAVDYAFAFGSNCKARKGRSFAYGAHIDVKEIDSAAFGQNITLNAPRSFSAGYHNVTNNWVNIALGEELTTNNRPEFATGAYNNSVNDSTASGQTLFSVGNGASASARHNAFEIRQNGDIYVNDGTNDVRLQDTILALGGLKFVQCTQAEYDSMVSGGTVDSSTIYFITNVVS